MKTCRALCTGVVDVCLIPEVKFDLQGKSGLLAYVQGLLDKRGHCVVCIAEGAGQVLHSLHPFGTLPEDFVANLQASRTSRDSMQSGIRVTLGLCRETARLS